MPSNILPVLIIVFLVMLPSLYAAKTEVAVMNNVPDHNFTFPKGDGPFPCLIICPGRGYHKELPLIKGLAKQATLNGFAAVRFDWTFYSTKEKPSEDGSTEMEDIAAVMQMIKANPKVDTTRIYIAGKSLGSLLAYATFREDPNLKGCILLTPILPSATAGEDYYPNLTYEMRPITFILGDKDKDNCPLTELYKLLSTCARAFPVVVLTGGHSFELGYDEQDPILRQFNAINIQTAIDNAIYWLKTFEYPNLNK